MPYGLRQPLPCYHSFSAVSSCARQGITKGEQRTSITVRWFEYSEAARVVNGIAFPQTSNVRQLGALTRRGEHFARLALPKPIIHCLETTLSRYFLSYFSPSLLSSSPLILILRRQNSHSANCESPFVRELFLARGPCSDFCGRQSSRRRST
jgi:hypothetical protein